MALAPNPSSMPQAQVQQLVARQQWFKASSTVLRGALKLLQLGSSWQHLAEGAALHKYGYVFHLAGRAWCNATELLLDCEDSESRARQQLIESGACKAITISQFIRIG
jgi:hypothetical protein